jgi:hypothetical protein
VPFKFHCRGRHHIPRQKFRVTNWREYEAALRNRGSLTVWFQGPPRAESGCLARPKRPIVGDRDFVDRLIDRSIFDRNIYFLQAI